MPFICLILEVTHIQSQTNKFDFGMSGGVGLVNLRGSDTFNERQQSMLGYTGSFFFQFNLKRVISIHTGISGELKGTSTEIVLTDHTGKPLDEIKLKTNLYYVSIPFLIRANFGKKNYFFINAGGYTAYLLNNSTSDQSGTKATNFYPLKDFDFGISSGLGISLPLNSKSAFSSEIRYNLGLYDVYEGLASNIAPIKTNSLILLVSYNRKFGFRE